MKPIWIFFLVFGILVLVFPEFIVNLIGTILIMIGVGILLPNMIANVKKNDSSFRFGDYEFTKKKK